MRGLTGFSRLPEILKAVESVKLVDDGSYTIDVDSGRVSTYLTELQSMTGTISCGLAALNFSLVDLTNESEISRNQLSDLLMLQAGLNELNHLINESAHTISMATPIGDQA